MSDLALLFSCHSLQAEAHPSHPISFFIALKQRNLDILEDFFWAVSDPEHKHYRQFKSISEINDLIAPPTSDKKKFMQWLNAGISFSKNSYLMPSGHYPCS